MQHRKGDKNVTNMMKLKGKIVEKGFNVNRLAEAIGLDSSTLYRKLNDDGLTISIGEANKIVETLKLNSNEAMNIFFADHVA